MGRIQRYISKLTGKPTVCYLADDNYSYDSCRGIRSYIHRFWLRKYVGSLARDSKQMFVIVDKEKEDTDNRFGTNSVILTKGIDFSNKKYYHNDATLPLKFVYTGNLLIGRDKTLAILADTINDLNKDGIKAELFIYSQTEPTEQILGRINRSPHIFVAELAGMRFLRCKKMPMLLSLPKHLKEKKQMLPSYHFQPRLQTIYLMGNVLRQ